MATAGAVSAKLVLDSQGFTSGITSAANLTDREMKRAAGAVKYVNDYLKETARLTKVVGESSEGIKQSSKHMEEFGFQTAGAKRELLVLGHELSQGNYKRFAGSLLVLGERTGAAGLLFSGLGIAALAATAAVGGFALALFQGAEESKKFNDSLKLTGNFAGITATEMDRLVKVTGNATGRNLASVRDAYQGLISTGQLGPRVLAPAAEAVVTLEKITGQKSEEIVKDFAKMDDGVAKWAVEHNKSMNFVTAGQYAYIQRLEEQGKKEEAELETLRLLNQHLGSTMPQNLGLLERAWKSLGETASEAWDSMKGIGRADTLDDRIAKLQNRLDSVRMAGSAKPLLGSSGLPHFNASAAEEVVQSELKLAYMDKLRQSEKAAGDAESGRMQKAGIAAREIIDQTKEKTKGFSLLTKEIEKYKRLFAEAEAAGAGYSKADKEAVFEHLRKQYGGKSKDIPLTAIRDPQAQYKSDFLRTEIESYDELAKAAEREAKAEEARQKALTKRLADNQIVTDEMIARLDEDTKYLGLNTMERRIAVEQIKIEAEARKELANGSDPAQVLAAAEKRKGDIADGIRRNAEAQKSFTFGAKQSFKQYQLDAYDAAKNAAALLDGGLKKTEDALIEFVKTGKLSFSSLFAFMAEEYLRQQIRMSIADFLPGGKGSGGASLLAGFVSLFKPHAQGLDYVPYDGYPALLHEGEKVQTRAQAQGGRGSGGIVIDASTRIENVGAGVSRGEMNAAVAQASANTEKRMRRLMQQGMLV